jgi:hypothetical protein
VYSISSPQTDEVDKNSVIQTIDKDIISLGSSSPRSRPAMPVRRQSSRHRGGARCQKVSLFFLPAHHGLYSCLFAHLRVCCRCNDIVAQEPVALHAHALKNRNPPLTLCKSHFGTMERKRRRELETRKKTKLDESEMTARYLYLKAAPPPKPQNVVFARHPELQFGLTRSIDVEKLK